MIILLTNKNNVVPQMMKLIKFMMFTIYIVSKLLILFSLPVDQVLEVRFDFKNVCNFWLEPKATNLCFPCVSQAGVLARVQSFSGVFSLVIYITCHMITAEDSRGNDERKGAARKFSN